MESSGEPPVFPVRFNAQGLPMSAELPGPEEPCIVFLGDSFTVAREVPENLRFVSRIGRALKIRTLNFGCPSFCPLLSRIQLEHYAGQLKLKAVVLLLFANDIPGDAEMRPLAIRDPTGRIVAVPGRRDIDWLTPVRSSQAARMVRHGWRALLAYLDMKARSDGAVRAFGWTPYFTKPIPEWYDPTDLEFTEGNILEIAELCKQRGCPFLLSVVPDRGALVLGIPDYFAIFVEELAARHSITYVDLVSRFREHSTDHPVEELYFPRDAHFTSKGHVLVAEAFAAQLQTHEQ